MTTSSRKQLAKIYYQNREVKYINILFGDEHRRIYIGSSIDISGKEEIITMSYDQTEHDDDGNEKEFNLCEWEVKDHLDKVQVNHIMDSGIMIEWLSYQGNVKSSLFIPMVRLLHINVDAPQYDDEQPPKGIIDK